MHNSGTDQDADGFTLDAYTKESGLQGGDCDDNDGWAAPGNVEVCDQIDNDCDGTVDEDCTDAGAILDPSKGGCDCDATGGGLGWPVLVWLLPLVLRRRWGTSGEAAARR